MGRFQLSGLNRVRRTLIGQPLPTSAHAEERLNNAEALAILSSDALSSVAYATQEIVCWAWPAPWAWASPCRSPG
ncbi:MAG: hypothetical protein RLZZ263_1198 [Cyanobacteriota bacterium]|jgi:hypothetical protein